ITSIRVQDTRKGTIIRVEHEGGIADFPADEFRRLVGRRKLRSWKPAVRHSGSNWIFSGKGFGHGVGLCQWGACGMAKEGYAWPSILRHYYPGAETIRVY
ncbi:stage II sporulation protein SpoIID, partial [Planctomycetota bacterium]